MPENNTSEIDEIDDLMRRIYARQEKATTVDRGEGEDAEAMEKPDARDRLLSQKAMRDMAQQEAGEQLRRELEIAGRPAQRFQVTLPDGSVYNLVSESVYRDIMTRAEAAERRVAELEAQLAAGVQERRPVSERPDSSACLYEVTVRASWDGDVFMTHGNLYMPHDGPDILRWRPAPPQEWPIPHGRGVRLEERVWEIGCFTY